jgi:hypothetical protein
MGDPTVMGWVTVVAYFTAAALCFGAARRAQRIHDWQLRERELGFWFVLVIVLCALGVNKQLDLQSWFTQVGREIARASGWYQDRRVLQTVFVAGIALGGLATLAFVVRACWGTWRRKALALVGIIVLSAFVVVRAASFHHFDVLLKLSFLGVSVNAVLELSGLVCIGVAAASYLNRDRGPASSPPLRPRSRQARRA